MVQMAMTMSSSLPERSYSLLSRRERKPSMDWTLSVRPDTSPWRRNTQGSALSPMTVS